jgi:DUF2950 family protein
MTGLNVMRTNWNFPHWMETHVMDKHRILIATSLLIVPLVIALDSNVTHAQSTFATPEGAVEVLTKAVSAHNTDELLTIFGPEAQEVLSSGDPVADRWGREVVSIALQEHWELGDLDEASKELVIGNERWPFPIPLVKGPDGWYFDSEAGEAEVLTRRIGRNELFVIGVSRTYVRAQNEYAQMPRDRNPAGIYAQKMQSDPGKQDGLYWATERGEKRSPLGALAARAAKEGYSVDPKEGARPFHGYYFRILTGQGRKARGGSLDYVVDGQMTRGFALVAYPADYANSGIMTFIVNQDGVVYERDLGPDTATRVVDIEKFNPGRKWQKVE